MLSGSLSNLLLFKMVDIDEIQEKKNQKHNLIIRQLILNKP